MEEIRDILKAKGYDEDAARACPFSAPENYFSSIEDSVRGRMREGQDHPLTGYEKILRAIKAPAMLVLTFGIIFGLGYGVTALTSTINPDAFPIPESGIMALVDEGYISSDFIEDYYDQIDLNQMTEHFLEGIRNGDPAIEEDLLEGDLTREEIIDYYLGY